MGYIFISYSHSDKDKAYAHKLHQHLFEQGFDAWIDDRLNYGSRWPHEIEKRLNECSAFILIMSANSHKSEWVLNELEQARELQKPIFPLLLDGEIWWHLRTTQYIDVRDGELPPTKFFVSLTQYVFQPNDIDTPNISINIGGNVQGNIVIGNDNDIQSSPSKAEIAWEKAEQDRLVLEKQKRDQAEREAARIAAEKTEQDRLALERQKRDQAEREAARIAAEKAEQDRLALEKRKRDQAEREAARIAAEKAEQDRLAFEKLKNRQTSPSKNKVFLPFVSILVIFFIVMFGLGTTNKLGPFNFTVHQATLPLRFVFVIMGVAMAFAVYFFTKENKIWEVGTREVVYMAVGTVLYAIFSYLFNDTVFVVPSLSQVSLRPAIAIPMFFGYAFGPAVGFFIGAVGNMFGDALTGFGLSPQWSIGNGLVGFISGLVFLFKDKKKSADTVFYISGAMALLAVVFYFFNSSQANLTYFDPANNVFGDSQISFFAGISILIGLILVAAVRFGFAKNGDLAAGITWGILGNILGIGFAAISDIWINGLSLPAAVVGEFLPAAGPNLIFAAILVPLLVAAYAAVQRQSGR